MLGSQRVIAISGPVIGRAQVKDKIIEDKRLSSDSHISVEDKDGMVLKSRPFCGYLRNSSVVTIRLGYNSGDNN